MAAQFTETTVRRMVKDGARIANDGELWMGPIYVHIPTDDILLTPEEASVTSYHAQNLSVYYSIDADDNLRKAAYGQWLGCADTLRTLYASKPIRLMAMLRQMERNARYLSERSYRPSASQAVA